MSKQSTLDLTKVGIASFMLCLKALVTPKKIIHIGAGRGIGDLHAWQSWDIANALIIEADIQRTDWTRSLVNKLPHCQVIEAVVAETVTEVEYFQASHPDEDSFFPVQELNCVWSNMRVVQSQVRKTETLSNLLAQVGFVESLAVTVGIEAPIGIWAIVDCLPAESILKSAGRWMDHFGVVIARVLLAPIPGTSEVGQNASVEAYMQSVNFKSVAVFESSHPSIGYAFYIKDWSVSTIAQAFETKQTLLKSKDEQVKIQNELAETKFQMQRLTFDRDTQLVTIEVLKAAIEAQQQELAHANEQLKKIELLQQEKGTAELLIQNRQEHLHGDLIRAEAQIELIKDLVFTRKAL
jgi:hypothetical protein